MLVYEDIEGEETPKDVLRYRKKYMNNLQKSQLEFEEVSFLSLFFIQKFFRTDGFLVLYCAILDFLATSDTVPEALAGKIVCT